MKKIIIKLLKFIMKIHIKIENLFFAVSKEIIQVKPGFDVYDKKKFLLIEKNKYIVSLRKNLNNLTLGDVAIDNSNKSWNNFWGSSKYRSEYQEGNRLAFFEDIVSNIIKYKIEGDIIDVGCGNGYLINLLKRRLKKNNKYTGVDFSEDGIKFCRNKYTGIVFEQADIYDLSYKNNSFDAIICTEVLEHLEYPVKALQELMRICSVNGYIFISVPNGEIDSYIGHINFWSVGNIKKSLEIDKTENCDVNIYTIQNNKTIFCVIRKIDKKKEIAIKKKIIIGSSNSNYKDFVSTEKEYFNLLNRKDFIKLIEQENSIKVFLAEHVWEHLTLNEARVANKNCYDFLKHGGRLRIAVPDGFHPSKKYINYVKPGGNGAGSDDHKVLYNYKLLAKELEVIGFKVNLLEYWDEKKEFHYNEWNPEDGFIKRSKRFDSRNKGGKLKYTSLIVDAIKE